MKFNKKIIKFSEQKVLSVIGKEYKGKITIIDIEFKEKSLSTINNITFVDDKTPDVLRHIYNVSKKIQEYELIMDDEDTSYFNELTFADIEKEAFAFNLFLQVVDLIVEHETKKDSKRLRRETANIRNRFVQL